MDKDFLSRLVCTVKKDQKDKGKPYSLPSTFLVRIFF